MILGLSALAVVQPLLDLFGNNPEFFVAGNYSTSQIVLFALAITIIPPALGIGLTALATAIDRRLGQVVFVAVIGVLATAFGLALLRTIGVDQLVVVALLAVLIGAGIVVLVLRTKGVRLLVSYLAVANLFFLATFLFFSPASELVAGASSADVGDVDVPTPGGPVVLLVLDELPAATFMRADGSLNAERYPGFAELASVSTWFRNASSQYNLTHRAVPSILDGTLAEPDDLPTYADHPRNLFTLLGGVVPVRRYESVTDMCPPEVCAPPPRQPLGQAFEDASIVYGHRVLPSALRDELPAIDNSWGCVRRGRRARRRSRPPGARGDRRARRRSSGKAYAKWQGLPADERSPLGQAGILRDEIAAITGEPALHVVHVALPHRPWVLSPHGAHAVVRAGADHRAGGAGLRLRRPHGVPAAQHAGRRRRHARRRARRPPARAAELGGHDARRDVRPRDQPDGAEHRPDEGHRRQPRGGLPGPAVRQGAGSGRRRDPTTTAPRTSTCCRRSIDLLGADVDWDIDGHSLYDGSEAHGRAEGHRRRRRRRWRSPPAAPRSSRYGDDWTALAAVGPHGDLVGRHVDDLDVGAAVDVGGQLDQAELFGDLPTAAGELPLVLAGSVAGTATPSRPSCSPPSTDASPVSSAATGRRRALVVHRLRRRLLPRRGQRRGAVRGATRRRRASPCSGDVMRRASASSSTVVDAVGIPRAR